jgi:hypothetical protein
MYQFSRSIYRELAPRVVEDVADPTGCRNKQRVLDACEAAIVRLMTDRHYFARPARWLFYEIRPYFGLADQLHAWTVVETNINLAVTFLDRLPAGVGLDGSPPRCRALTRRGTACQRAPVPDKEYCPSHSHLEEPLVEQTEVEQTEVAVAA